MYINEISHAASFGSHDGPLTDRSALQLRTIVSFYGRQMNRVTGSIVALSFRRVSSQSECAA